MERRFQLGESIRVRKPPKFPPDERKSMARALCLATGEPYPDWLVEEMSKDSEVWVITELAWDAFQDTGMLRLGEMALVNMKTKERRVLEIAKVLKGEI